MLQALCNGENCWALVAIFRIKNLIIIFFFSIIAIAPCNQHLEALPFHTSGEDPPPLGRVTGREPQLPAKQLYNRCARVHCRVHSNIVTYRYE